MMAVDVLMVVHSRPEYSVRTLPRLLEVCEAEGGRLWLWQNGSDAEVGAIVEKYRSHPAMHRVHHEPANSPLRDATNWMWRESDGEFVGKVDDDCLIRPGWISTMVDLHGRGDRFGALCAWHYAPEDFDESIAGDKIAEVDGVRLLRNMWTAGSGYIMPRALVDECEAIRDEESWHGFSLRASQAGWISGWPLPLVLQDHLDDPRVEGAGVQTDADLARYLPLSARSLGIQTVDEWTAALRNDARHVLTASIDPAAYRGIGRLVRKVVRRLGLGNRAARRKPIY